MADDEIDALIAIARSRMDAADPAILGLRPAELDWLEAEELAKYSNLILQLPRSGEIQQAARARVASKRAERLRAMSLDRESLAVQLPNNPPDAFDRVFAGVTSSAMDELLGFIDPNGVNGTVNGLDLVESNDPHLEIFRALVRAHDELKARGR